MAQFQPPPAYDSTASQPLTPTADLPWAVGTGVSCGIKWDFVEARSVCDLDIQAVAVDGAGRVVDVVYYNNLKAAGRGLTHSGDSLDGKDEGIDEKVTIWTNKLPDNIPLILIMVCCADTMASTGRPTTFRDVARGDGLVIDEDTRNVLYTFTISDKGDATACLIGAIHRDPQTQQWAIRLIDQTANGHNFMDLLQDNFLTPHIQTFIPTAPMKQKMAFNMRKGNVMPFSNQQNVLQCCLGWDVGHGGGVDLDTSCVAMNTTGTPEFSVYFGSLVGPGVRHSGDDLTGRGDGDDEIITVELDKIPVQVIHLFFVINIFTRGVTFKRVKRPYCRIVDPNLKAAYGDNGAELCRYELDTVAGHHTAMILARLQRDQFNRWGFHALGIPSYGATHRDLTPELTQLTHMRTGALLHSQSSVGGGAGVPPQTYAAPSQAYGQPYTQPPPPPPPPQTAYRGAGDAHTDESGGDTCCCVQ